MRSWRMPMMIVIRARTEAMVPKMMVPVGVDFEPWSAKVMVEFEAG